jgi:hypothetical protein
MSQQFSRDTWSVVIAAGLTADFSTVCDYFYVSSIVDGGGVAQTILLSVNKPNTFAPIASAQGGQGRVGAGDIQTLKFKNNGSASVTVTMIFGNGAANFNGDVTALANAINKPLVLKLVCEDLAAGSGPKVYSGMKSIEVISNTVGQNVRVQSVSGMDYQIAGGLSKEWSCENDDDYFEDITVTPPAGGSATVTGVKA